jgi:outer membrane protein
LRVSEAYFNVLRAEETLASAKAEEAALKRQLEQSQKRFEVGLIAKTDVLEAQAQLDGSTAARISQEVGLASANEVLAGIIGNNANNSANCALILLLPLLSLTTLKNGLNWLKTKTLS